MLEKSVCCSASLTFSIVLRTPSPPGPSPDGRGRKDAFAVPQQIMNPPRPVLALDP